MLQNIEEKLQTQKFYCKMFHTTFTLKTESVSFVAIKRTLKTSNYFKVSTKHPSNKGFNIVLLDVRTKKP